MNISFDFETKTVTLNSGYEMPINGLGTYSLHGDECIDSVKSALQSGVRLIDTASAYGNEEEVGRAVREAIEEGLIEREDVFVITKIYPGSEMANPEESIQAYTEPPECNVHQREIDARMPLFFWSAVNSGPTSAMTCSSVRFANSVACVFPEDVPSEELPSIAALTALRNPSIV